MKPSNHHIWDESSRFTLYVGPVRVSQTDPACGQNPHNLSTNYPQERWIKAIFYISVRLKTTPQIWGAPSYEKSVTAGGFPQ